ncbi:MAG TPA: hypothetical protein VK868_07230 [Pyrinomonadaceae bacterium]|nr:hypothetical protein [Pyrinomonadaceae bacterium]
MPKDATKNIDRYKIRGGQLNEFEYAENQKAFAGKKPKGEGKLIPGTPPEEAAAGLQPVVKAKAGDATKGTENRATKGTQSRATKGTKSPKGNRTSKSSKGGAAKKANKGSRKGATAKKPAARKTAAKKRTAAKK